MDRTSRLATIASLLAWFVGATAAVALGFPPRLAADLSALPFPTFHEDFLAQDSAVFGQWIVFSHDDGIHGRELWRTDGTPEGTALVADVCPGVCPGRLYQQWMAVDGDRLFFSADDGVTGVELWVTEGDAATTRQVADLAPGAGSSEPRWPTPTPAGLFFEARDATGTRRLHLTDGTAAGTTAVPQAPEGAIALTPLGPGVVFGGTDADHGLEPWVSDGTTASLLKDIDPGPADGLWFWVGWADINPMRWLGLDDLVLFAATDPVGGQELWRTDGTPAGTQRVADLAPGAVGSDPQSLGRLGAWAVFVADDGTASRHLWLTDGSEAGTVRLTPADPMEFRWATAPHVVGNRVFFFFISGSGPLLLWISDGTPGGTELVQTTPPQGEPWFLAPSVGSVGDRFLFLVEDPVHFLELWTSDGTDAGTVVLAELTAGLPYVQAIHEVGGRGVFVAWQSEQLEREPWVTDGTPGGTGLLADLDTQTSSVLPCPFGRCSHCYAAFCGESEPLPDGGLAFVANATPYAPDLFRSGGGFGNATPIGLPGWGDFRRVAQPVPVGGGLAFFGEGQSIPARIRWTDGGEPVELPVPLQDDEAPPGVASWNGSAYFATLSGLWSSDGTPAGTLELAPDPVTELLPTPQALYAAGVDLLVTDGSPGGTLALTSSAVLSYPDDLAFAPQTGGPGRLFFSATTAAEGRELWVLPLDTGTALRLGDAAPGPVDGIGPMDSPFWRGDDGPAVVAFGAGAVFRADDGVHGAEPWVSDGTVAGSYLLADLATGPYPSEPHAFTPVGDRLFFVATTPELGQELWVTDGTLFGTHPVRDLAPGPASAMPGDLVAVDDRLLFRAWTPATGAELWETDGSWFGTTLVADLAPGPLSSSPVEVTRSGNEIFFFATDGARGFEPWRLPLSPEIFADGFETGDTIRWEGE